VEGGTVRLGSYIFLRKSSDIFFLNSFIEPTRRNPYYIFLFPFTKSVGFCKLTHFANPRYTPERLSMDIHNLKIQSEYVQMDLYMNFYNIFVSLSDSHMNSKKMIHII
jgi:hypothetical protein